ncbi:MAG: 4'-phosphopantetheinyl transferase superfamily protein [Desulfatiglandaceae bacterium]
MTIRQVPSLPATIADPRLIHVHVCHLDLPAKLSTSRSAMLSPEERERIGRYRNPRLRKRMAVARSWVRVILGHYLAMDPAAICFRANSHEKPALKGDAAQSLAFNLSHSENIMLLAVSNGQPVGIDLEVIKEISDLPALAGRYFSPDEQVSLDQSPGPERTSGFYRIWTRKEACLKAWGIGLEGELNRFSTHSEWTMSPKDRKGCPPLYITELPVDGPFLAALASPVLPTRILIARAAP